MRRKCTPRTDSQLGGCSPEEDVRRRGKRRLCPVFAVPLEPEGLADECGRTVCHCMGISRRIRTTNKGLALPFCIKLRSFHFKQPSIGIFPVLHFQSSNCRHLLRRKWDEVLILGRASDVLNRYID